MPVAVGDCSQLNFNAIAKGYIVDLTGAAALEHFGDEILSLVVNAGGDLRHWGQGSRRVAIEPAFGAIDNAQSVSTVEISNLAVATSGQARRYLEIAGRRYGHVLDPRSGMPVDQIASITVAAPNAMLADVLATIAGVEGVALALEILERCDGVEGLVIDRVGAISRTSGWPAS